MHLDASKATGLFLLLDAATCVIEFAPQAPKDRGMIRARIANAVIVSIIVAEILGAMMLLLHQ